jgi:hypothetical protein
MENKIVISFVVEQVAAALEDTGFEASEQNVSAISQYIDNGGDFVEDFDAAFRTLISDAATDLRSGKRINPLAKENQAWRRM